MTVTSAPRDQASTILWDRQPSEPRGFAVIVLKAGVGPERSGLVRDPGRAADDDHPAEQHRWKTRSNRWPAELG